MKHSNDPVCSRCNQILSGANTDIAYYVWVVRQEFPDAHVSCAYRGEAAQNEAYANGLSKKRWPDSKHNIRDKNGNPCSEAVDFFQITDGAAIWDKKFFSMIHGYLKSQNAPIRWGGTWEKFKDYPHFEMRKLV